MHKRVTELRFNCDRLWKLWYSVLVILMQMLMISLAVSKYLTYRYQAFDPRYGGQWLLLPLNFQLAMIILSLSIMVFFIYSCLFKVGNIANDGIELGIDPHSIRNALHDISLYRGMGLFLARLSTHLLPYSCLIHVIIALFLAIPVPLLQAEQIKNEAISQDWILRTDIDFILRPAVPLVAASPKEVLPSSPRCYEDQTCVFPSQPSAILPEYINLVVALFILTVRIPTPFWYTNKAFSIIFSVFAFLSALSISLEYQAVALYVKVVHNSALEPTTNWLMSGWSLLLLFLTKCLLQLIMIVVVFEYGYTQFLASMRQYRQYLSFDMADSVSQQSLDNRQVRWYQMAPRLAGSLLLALVLTASAPIMLALLQLRGRHTASLLGLAASLLYFIACLFLWFGLCVKSKWQFHVNVQTHNPLAPPGHPGASGANKSIESPEPVYGCFYNAPSICSSHNTSISKHPGMLRPDGLVGGGSETGGSQRNYVYMHPAVLPIHERSEYHLMPGGGGSETSVDSSAYRMGPTRDGAQYTTLASLKAGGLVLAPQAGSAGLHSDTSSSDANYGIAQQRRGSTRVTFKEHVTVSQPNTEHGVYEHGWYNNALPGSLYRPPPDILSDGQALIRSSDPPVPVARHPDFDPEMEMSTDMRQKQQQQTSNPMHTSVTSNNDNKEDKNKDPRMCSQV